MTSYTFNLQGQLHEELNIHRMPYTMTLRHLVSIMSSDISIVSAWSSTNTTMNGQTMKTHFTQLQVPIMILTSAFFSYTCRQSSPKKSRLGSVLFSTTITFHQHSIEWALVSAKRRSFKSDTCVDVCRNQHCHQSSYPHTIHIHQVSAIDPFCSPLPKEWSRPLFISEHKYRPYQC